MYRLVKTSKGDLILSQELIPIVMKALGFEPHDYAVTEGAWTGTELEGIVCRHPWIDREARVILGDFVIQDQGTGAVHIAPGHGPDDYVTGQRYAGTASHWPWDSEPYEVISEPFEVVPGISSALAAPLAAVTTLRFRLCAWSRTHRASPHIPTIAA